MVVRDGDADDEFGDDEGDDILSLDITDFFTVFMNLRQASQAYIPYFRDCGKFFDVIDTLQTPHEFDPNTEKERNFG